MIEKRKLTPLDAKLVQLIDEFALACYDLGDWRQACWENPPTNGLPESYRALHAAQQKAREVLIKHLQKLLAR